MARRERSSVSDLLTAKDVEVKVFKKVKFGGYSVPEVEDFLNQVADDLEAYTIQLDEKEARVQELEAFVKKQEGMTDAIKDALIQARKAAQDMEEQAKIKAEKIIADAQVEAEKHIAEADGKVQERVDEAGKKADEIVIKAENRANEIIQASQNKKAQAEQSRANIEYELESQRRAAKDQADEILIKARAEAQRLISDAQKEIAEYEKQIQFLHLQKQQFLKNSVSLLMQLGDVLDRAQQDIDEEISSGKVNDEDNNVNDEQESN